jgi:hypothetical protein
MFRCYIFVTLPALSTLAVLAAEVFERPGAKIGPASHGELQGQRADRPETGRIGRLERRSPLATFFGIPETNPPQLSHVGLDNG